ncbi:MAG: YnbE family lipoprotein [Rhodospirillales bacterium]
MTERPQRPGRLGLVFPAWALAVAVLVVTGCEPKVQVTAPDKPIVINLNVKIEHEVRVKLEKDVDDLLKKNSDLF